MNSINIVGRLVKAVELKYVPGSGKAVATGVVAVDRRFQDKTDFIPVQVWGNSAEKYFAPYGSKGRLIEVTGELHIDSWKDNEDNWKQKAYIAANNVKFLFGNKSNGEELTESESEVEGFSEIEDDDIPF